MTWSQDTYDDGVEDGENNKQVEWELALKAVLPASMIPDDEDENIEPSEVAEYIKRLREGKVR